MDVLHSPEILTSIDVHKSRNLVQHISKVGEAKIIIFMLSIWIFAIHLNMYLLSQNLNIQA